MSWRIFDKKYVDYDRWFEEKGKNIYISELEAIKEIKPNFNRDSIEIGVGTGRFASPLNIKYGLEPSIKMAKKSLRRSIKVIIGVAEELPFKKESFDSALMIVTVCFLDNLEKSFSEINRILRKNGELIIGFVPSESSWGKFYLKKKREGHPYYKYAKFYTFDEIKHITEKNGFYIEVVVSTLLSPPHTFKETENPLNKHSQKAGFIIIKAKKSKF